MSGGDSVAHYTTQVRSICESLAGYAESQGYISVGNAIELARPKIFSFSYPIFENTYKSVLETKILKHYYTREIGLESFGLWQLKLDTKLNEIMPYYNQMYKSTLMEFNPLVNVDLTTKYGRQRKGTQNDVNKNTSNSVGSNTGDYTKQQSDDFTGNIDVTIDTALDTKEDSNLNTDTINDATGKETRVLDSTTNTVTHDESETDGTTNVKTANNSTTDTTENIENTMDTTSLDAYSDTPQGTVQDLLDLNYLTNARNITGNQHTVGESTKNETTIENGASDTILNNKTTGDGTQDVTGEQRETTDNTVNETGNVKTTINNTGESNENTTQNTATQNSNKMIFTESNKIDMSNDVTSQGNLDKQFANTEDFLQHIAGVQGVNISDLILKYRETFINVDMMIIRELAELFMLIW